MCLTGGALRHTFCSHLAMRGAPARAIQELAGHRDLSTTQRYMHLSPAAKEAAIRLLDEPPPFPDFVSGFGDIVETGKVGSLSATNDRGKMVPVQGLEPCRGSFSNAVTACDFWSNGFVFSRLPRRVECSPVLPSPLESTPVVERIRRAEEKSSRSSSGPPS